MAKDLWLTLPVKDVLRSTEFFKKIGFTLNEGFDNNEHGASFFINEKKNVLMLFPEGVFKHMSRGEISDTSKSSEILISIDAESPAEVDDYARKAEEAGGNVFGEPSDIQGFMYGCGFTDLDGHKWNVLYMDVSKMTQG